MGDMAAPAMSKPKPTIHLSTDDLDLDGLKLGESVTLTVTGRVTNLSAKSTDGYPGSVTLELSKVARDKETRVSASKKFAI